MVFLDIRRRLTSLIKSLYENINDSINYLHVQHTQPKVDFHLHEGFEIYFLISGDINYFVEKKVYQIRYGDLIITNNHEIHKPNFLSDKLYDRITLHFKPSITTPFSSPMFDLLYCFTNRSKGEQNKISLNDKQLETILRLFNKIEQLYISPKDGDEILKLNYLIELLVYINRIFINSSYNDENQNIPPKLIPILDFIDNNLEGNLSLSALEKKFFIDKFYLSRIFKKSTGSTIHDYIIYKRISKAKILLSEGFSVTESCYKSGFNDYSNFLRIFKKTVGVSPGKYTLPLY